MSIAPDVRPNYGQNKASTDGATNCFRLRNKPPLIAFLPGYMKNMLSLNII
jgi:hypothetical protein